MLLKRLTSTEGCMLRPALRLPPNRSLGCLSVAWHLKLPEVRELQKCQCPTIKAQNATCYPALVLSCPHPVWAIVRVQSAPVTSPVPQPNWICWLKHYSRSSVSHSWGITMDIWCLSFQGSLENSRCNSMQNRLFCPLTVRTFVRVC